MVRRLLWDNKVLGTSMGTRVAAAQGPATAGPARGFLEENQFNGSLPCQTGRFEKNQDRPGSLMWLGGIKTRWQMHRGSVHPLRLWTPAGSVPEKLGSQVTPGAGITEGS